MGDAKLAVENIIVPLLLMPKNSYSLLILERRGRVRKMGERGEEGTWLEEDFGLVSCDYLAIVWCCCLTCCLDAIQCLCHGNILLMKGDSKDERKN